MARILALFQGRQDLALITLLMCIILVMIIPLPTFIIDVLITFSITLTILILIVAVYLKRPEEFSSFPAVILIATTFRLSISISTTRLILANGDAGAIIDTFGHFVTKGSVIVGLVIFLIITTVQFLVITKGAERVAEVAARFTLDGLPGRQMSIDSELRAGDITVQQAQRRRSQLDKQNQFFGAMDGAMKFVKGDAIAGLIIVVINIIGGISVGMIVEGMPAATAVDVYSRLTIGDGLVGQIPALIISLCAGTVITRVDAGTQNDLGTEIIRQLAGNPKSMYLGAGLVTLMGLIPGFPTMIFVTLAAMLAGFGYHLSRQIDRDAETDGPDTVEGQNKLKADSSARPVEMAKEDIAGIGLGEKLSERINRKEFALVRDQLLEQTYARVGIYLTNCGLFTDREIDPHEFRVLLDSVNGFSAAVPEKSYVAVCDPEILEINNIANTRLDDKWALRSAYWVGEEALPLLNKADVRILSASELVAKTAVHFLRDNLARILSYRHVQAIIRELASEHEQLASQISQTLTAVQLLNVIRRLMEENVPLMPRRILFEALLEASVGGGNADHLAEAVRGPLARQICAQFADRNGLIAGYVIEPSFEIVLRSSLQQANDTTNLDPPEQVLNQLLGEARKCLQNIEIGSHRPVILTTTQLRAPMFKLLKKHNLRMYVLAFNEVSNDFQFHPIGAIGKLPANKTATEGAAA